MGMATGLSIASQCQRAPDVYEPTPKSERNRVPPICANCSGSGLQNRIHPYRLSRSSCFAPSRSVFSGSAIRRAHLGPVVPRQGDAAQDASQPLTPLETLRSLSLRSRRFAASHSTQDASQPLTPLETLRSLSLPSRRFAASHSAQDASQPAVGGHRPHWGVDSRRTQTHTSVDSSASACMLSLFWSYRSQ